MHSSHYQDFSFTTEWTHQQSISNVRQWYTHNTLNYLQHTPGGSRDSKIVFIHFKLILLLQRHFCVPLHCWRNYHDEIIILGQNENKFCSEMANRMIVRGQYVCVEHPCFETPFCLFLLFYLFLKNFSMVLPGMTQLTRKSPIAVRLILRSSPGPTAQRPLRRTWRKTFYSIFEVGLSAPRRELNLCC